MNDVFALVDCNNFYASCERVFNPKLNGKPIVVLSNNDGCIVARSNEAKTLGIPMAAPIHQYQHLIRQYRVQVFSSNYTLYGDMSSRVMRSLAMMVPKLEVYSIDEAFVQLPRQSSTQLMAEYLKIRQNILQWTGIPVAIGIAPTKTLAKLANKVAKNNGRGVCVLLDQRELALHLAQVPVADIWGIGRRLDQKLRGLGIMTAADLAQSDRHFMRKKFGVVMSRMIYELQGSSCLGLEALQPKKNIISSKSFGRPVTDRVELEQALACYVMRAWEKLRQQHSVACGLQVFLHTNPFAKKDPYYANSVTQMLAAPSNHPSQLIHNAKNLLHQIYRPGYRYKKVGVVLLRLIEATQPHNHSLLPETVPNPCEKSMLILEQINHKLGKRTMFLAAQGTQRPWQMAAKLKSQRYTTHWQELVHVY